MKKMMKISAFLLIVVMLISMTACSSSGSKSAERSMSGGAGDYNYDLAASPAAAPAPMASENSMSDSYYRESEDGGGEISSTVASNATDNRKITFSADYRIETKRFDEDYNSIVRLVNNTDGYIASEETDSRSYYSGNQGRNSYFSLRIPVDKYDTFLDNVSEIGDVVNKNKSSEDLTSEYFDTEARIELLNMRKDRLIEYIKEATDPEVIIEFERELTNVLYDLDQYEGNKRRLDRLVDYATINVALYEVITAETIGKDGQPLGERAQDAFDMSLNGVQEFLRNAAVFFAGAAPVIALIVVIIIVILLIRALVIRISEGYSEKFPRGLERKLRRAEKKMQAKLRKAQYDQQLKMAKKQPVYYSSGYQVPPAQQQAQQPAPAPAPVQKLDPVLQPEPQPAQEPAPASQPVQESAPASQPVQESAPQVELPQPEQDSTPLPEQPLEQTTVPEAPAPEPATKPKRSRKTKN